MPELTKTKSPSPLTRPTSLEMTRPTSLEMLKKALRKGCFDAKSAMVEGVLVVEVTKSSPILEKS